MGAGAGEDRYLYDFGGYTLLIDFYSSDEYVVTGWSITNRNDFSWETVASVIPPNDRGLSEEAVNDADKIAAIGGAEFYLGMEKQKALQAADERKLEHRFLEDGSLHINGGLTIYFDQNDRANRIKLDGPDSSSSRGLQYTGTLFDMISLYGLDHETEETEGRYPTVLYQYGNDELSIDIRYLKADPYTIATFDIYFPSAAPIYG
jgi:hypothetical protein